MPEGGGEERGRESMNVCLLPRGGKSSRLEPDFISCACPRFPAPGHPSSVPGVGTLAFQGADQRQLPSPASTPCPPPQLSQPRWRQLWRPGHSSALTAGGRAGELSSSLVTPKKRAWASVECGEVALSILSPSLWGPYKCSHSSFTCRHALCLRSGAVGASHQAQASSLDLLDRPRGSGGVGSYTSNQCQA